MENPAGGGQVIAIRRAALTDVDAMVDVMEVVAGEGRWIGRELPLDKTERAATFTASIEDPDEHLVLASTLNEQIVGHLGLGHNGIGHGELGMLLLPDARGLGLGSTMLAEAIAWADAHPVVHKITLQAWLHNTAAIGLYGKHGFEIEGTLRRHWRRRNGELWDAVVMGLPVTDRVGTARSG